MWGAAPELIGDSMIWYNLANRRACERGDAVFQVRPVRRLGRNAEPQLLRFEAYF